MSLKLPKSPHLVSYHLLEEVYGGVLVPSSQKSYKQYSSSALVAFIILLWSLLFCITKRDIYIFYVKVLAHHKGEYIYGPYSSVPQHCIPPL
jgi:hypothetical protein